jgi:hypothetical protein
VVADALACDERVLIGNKVNIWREIEADGATFVVDDKLAGIFVYFEQWLKMSPQEFQAMKARTTTCFAHRTHVQRAAERLPEILRGDAK